MTDFKAKKCTKFDFGWGSAPDPARGAYIAPSDPLAEFGGRFAAGGGAWLGKRRERGRGRGGRGKWRGGKGRAPKLLLNQAPQRLAMPLCHFSNIDVAIKYCLYYVNYLLFGQLTFY